MIVHMLRVSGSGGKKRLESWVGGRLWDAGVAMCARGGVAGSSPVLGKIFFAV